MATSSGTPALQVQEVDTNDLEEVKVEPVTADDPYSMFEPRLGIAVIIKNYGPEKAGDQAPRRQERAGHQSLRRQERAGDQSARRQERAGDQAASAGHGDQARAPGEWDGTQADADALRQTLRDVGFDVYCYKDCSMQEIKRIHTWLLSRETHQFNNSLMYVTMSESAPRGRLWDSGRNKTYSLHQFITNLSTVETLRNKPKVVLAQIYTEGSAQKFKLQTNQNDFFIGCSTVPRESAGLGIRSFLATLADKLRHRYMTSSFSQIFHMTSLALESRSDLTDETLMRLALCISSLNMETIALTYLGLNKVTVDTIDDSRRGNREGYNLDVLRAWRDQSSNNSSQKLFELLSSASSERGIVNRVKVREILDQNPQVPVEPPQEMNTLRRSLHFSEFHQRHRSGQQAVGYDVRDQRELERLRDENLRLRVTQGGARGQSSSEKQQQLIKQLEDSESQRRTLEGENQNLKVKVSELEKKQETPGEAKRRKTAEMETVVEPQEMDVDENICLGSAVRDTPSDLTATPSGGNLIKKKRLDDSESQRRTLEGEIQNLKVKVTQLQEQLQGQQIPGESKRRKTVEMETVVEPQEMDVDENICLGSTVRAENTPLDLTPTPSGGNLIKTGRRLELSHISTLDIGELWCPGMTVVQSTGHVVISGYKTIDPYRLYEYSVTEGGEWWKEERIMKTPCGHGVHVLGAQVGGEEKLLVSCEECKNIKQLDPQNLEGEAVTVFKSQYKLARMCQGEGDTLYVHALFTGGMVLELNCSKSPFTVDREIKSSVNYCDGMCYIPEHRYLVMSDRSNVVVRSMSVESSNVQWEVRGEVDGEVIYPWGLLFLPEHGILVADECNSSILILDPSDGSHLQTIHPPDDMCYINDLCFNQDKVYMKHEKDVRYKLSCFTVK